MIAPPFVVTDHQIREIVQSLDRTLTDLER
jgi:hypothetical protein